MRWDLKSMTMTRSERGLHMNTDQLRYRVLSIPLNSSSPELPDKFDGPSDGLPAERDAGSTFNIHDLNSFCALTDFVTTLRVDGVVSTQVHTSLMTKLTDAEISSRRNNICAAMNVLNEFVNQVSAQLDW